MNDQLVRWVDEREGEVEFLLSCGHYAGPVHQASSTFDFPADVYDCEVCGKEVQMDLDLQASLYADRYGQ